MKPNFLRYHLCSASSPLQLTERVNEKMGDGYQPLGSPFSADTADGPIIAQAMVSDREEPMTLSMEAAEEFRRRFPEEFK